jgi:hypothetical protein
LGGTLSAIIGGLTGDKGAAIAEDCIIDCSDAPSHRWSSGRLSKYQRDPDKDSTELSTQAWWITGGIEDSNRLVSPTSLPQGRRGGRTPSGAAPASGATLRLENVLQALWYLPPSAHVCSHGVLELDGASVSFMSTEWRAA